MPRRKALQFLPNAGSEALVYDVIGPMTDHAGPSGVLFIGPVIQPIDLFVKLRWERLDPRSKFFSDELLQDLREGIALAEILIPSRFVNERNYSDSSKP